MRLHETAVCGVSIWARSTPCLTLPKHGNDKSPYGKKTKPTKKTAAAIELSRLGLLILR